MSRAGPAVARVLRPDLQGRTAYGAPQLDVPVQLNTNENAYPVPQPVAEALTRAVAATAVDLNRYPDREFTALSRDLAGYLHRQAGVALTPEQMWAGNGSNEVLQHVVQAFAGPGRVAMGFAPAYSMHPLLTRTSGARWVDGVRGADPAAGPFDLTAASAVAQVREHRPHVVFLCSPNNPTGNALPHEVAAAVLAAAPDTVVVVDEAYAEFARPGTPSALTLLAEHPLLVVTRTMSKAFALAGARVGYLAAASEVIDALRLVRMPYHLSSPTQALARAALAHASTMLGTVEAIKAQRDRIVTRLGELGYPPVASDANFVLFGGLADATVTWEWLLGRGVLVRDVGIPFHLRVTAGTPAETGAFLDAMGALPEQHRYRVGDLVRKGARA